MIITSDQMHSREFAPRIAVCLAGATNTLTHPHVVAGVAQKLLQPNMDLFAALAIDQASLAGTQHDAMVALAERSRLRSVLTQMRVVDYLLYERYANGT